MFKMKGCLTVTVLLLLVTPSCCLSLNKHGEYTEGCRRDMELRGDTAITCGTDLVKIGSHCYPPCPAGYTRSGTDCHQNCPAGSGWADHGLYCRLVEYGRGIGYGWLISDGLSNSGMFSRCEKVNGQGNCELSGAIVYPKCKPGFTAFGCCICRPAVPNCTALGYNDNVDLSCAKKLLCWDP